MNFVIQSRTGPNGNCFAACLASILDIPLRSIPDFGGDREFLGNIAEFLKPRGLLYVQVPPDDVVLKTMFSTGETLHTIEGRSPRGGQHAVVGCNGRMIHDPHPQDGTGRGLVTVECFGLLCQRFS